MMTQKAISSRTAIRIAAVFASVALPLLVVCTRCRTDRKRASFGELVTAANLLPYRIADARLSGSFHHKPVARTRGSAGDTPERWRLTVAAARVAEIARTSKAATDIHALGAAFFLNGDPVNAVATLEEALRKSSGEERPSLGIMKCTDAVLLSDLSAAYLAAASKNGRTYALLPAIASADRAVRIDPKALAASWNRAIALEALGVRDDARTSWDAYLRLDAEGEWAAEARQRRAALTVDRDTDLWSAAASRLQKAAESNDQPAIREIVRRFPSRCSLLVEQKFLPGWGRASSSSDAAAALRTAARISEAIADEIHDPLLYDITRAADANVALAYASFVSLGDAYRLGGRTAANAELVRIRDLLQRRRSPAAIRFSLALAYRLYEGRDHAAALAELNRLNGGWLQEYPLSRGQYYWYRGLVEISLGFADQAMQSFGDAIETFRRAGDAGAAGTVELMRADAAEYAGDIEQAWQSYGSALRDIDLHGESIMLDIVTFAVARSALRRGYPDAALILQNRRVERLRGSPDTAYVCQALIARCETNAILGRGREAQTDCGAARALFATIADPASRGRLQADLDVSTATAQASAGHSVAPLTSAIEVSIEAQDHFRIARLYLARSHAFERSRDLTAAEADLRSAIAEIEQQRSKLSSDEFRINWLDTWRTAYDELVSLLLRMNRSDEAFEAADAVRARVMLEHVTSFRSATIALVRDSLPAGAAFVQFWISSDDDIVTWIVRRDRTFCRQFAMRGATRRIRAALRALESPVAVAVPEEAMMKALFDDLVGPWFADVRGIRLLLLSPDGPLTLAPFAAILTGRHDLVIEPSAAFFVAQPRDAPQWTSVLFVDNPTSPKQGSEFPTLSTAAERHALSVGMLRMQTLRHSEATPARFMAAAVHADVIHFAGHAVDYKGGDGALLLASDDEHRDGSLSGRDIGRGPLRRGGLVVLAACRTSRGRISSEGSLSLTRSFLMTGSRAVIGSIWNVDDDATDLLFAAFYRHLGSSADVAQALRKAQTEIAATYPAPRYWAGFQVYGGV